MPRLTKRTVEAVRPGPKDIFIWDSTLPGFGVRVLPSGRRSYVIQYRAKGRTRRMTLGSHGVLTPEIARRLAISHLAEVNAGGDPSAARQADSRQPTVAELASRYMDQHARVKKKESSASADQAALKRHILPALGQLRVSDVTRDEVGRFHHSLRKTPVTANRVLALLSKMFNLAERWGLRPDGSNPCRHIDRYPERPRNRFLSSAELGRLGDSLRAVEGQKLELPSAVAAIRLLILTGARKAEILRLRWQYVDFERSCLRLPDSKTGAKLIYLNAPARVVLSELSAERTSSCPWVIPGRSGEKPLSGLTRIWHRIRARAALDDVRLHDLRHSYGAVAAGAGTTLHMIGRLLGQSQPSTTARYAHLADDPLREANEKIGGRIAAALGVGLDAEVIELRR